MAVSGNVTESRKPVLLLHNPAEPSELPSVFSTLTTTALHPIYVEPLRLMLICWPDVPLNVYRAFWPAVAVVAVRGVPTVIVPVTSVKLFSRSVMLPVVVPCGLTSTV